MDRRLSGLATSGVNMSIITVGRIVVVPLTLIVVALAGCRALARTDDRVQTAKDDASDLARMGSDSG
jgi:hypothetical protein